MALSILCLMAVAASSHDVFFSRRPLPSRIPKMVASYMGLQPARQDMKMESLEGIMPLEQNSEVEKYPKKMDFHHESTLGGIYHDGTNNRVGRF